MSVKQILILGASVLASALCGSAHSEERQGPYVQVAEIEIDQTQLETYKAAVAEHIETAIRAEPGILILYAVSHKENPAHVTVFEIYRDRIAYESHLQSPHFRKYKATTEKMVTSLKLIPADPIFLGSKEK